MKTLKFYIVAIITIVICSCSQESIIDEQFENQVETNNRSSSSTIGSANEKNSLIIKYEDGVNSFEKEQLRSHHGVESFKTCSCSDKKIEMWVFDLDSGDFDTIEEKKLTIDNEEEEEGIEGTHFNSDVALENTVNWQVGNVNTNDFLNKMVSENQNVTIAVLDTGVNPNYSSFTSPFLYRNRNINNCEKTGMSDYFGWDFVNNDNMPFDDNSHGTIVTSIINSKLNNIGVSHQILPVKVFDQDGKGNIFNILCGFIYAIEKPEVAIINLSFGSYKYQPLFHDLISEAQSKAIVVCSAGNDTNNNDVNPHYPSSYESGNILSVGGLSANPSSGQNSLAWFSNFGRNSVHLAAQSEVSMFSNGEIFSLYGTSYSCAYTSAKCAQLYYENVLPTTLKELVIEESIYSPQLYNIKHSSYIED